ncbi:MAG: MBL fold metallo-hydrolase [Thermodesulfobacteriota bacterium]
MEIDFLGVGEACDPECGNTALLIRTGQGATGNYILLDCGFTTPHRYFLANHDAEQLDAVWISHFHGDHFFGIPLLLLRFWEMGRRRPLLLAGPAGVGEKVVAALELAYPAFRERLGYPLRFVEATPGMELTEAGCRWRFAAMVHGRPAMAVRLEAEGAALFYSGDGRPSAESRTLAANCGVMVHEAYGIAEAPANHGTVALCLRVAAEADCGRLALVHVGRGDRERLARMLPVMAEEAGLAGRVFLPAPGVRWRL